MSDLTTATILAGLAIICVSASAHFLILCYLRFRCLTELSRTEFYHRILLMRENARLSAALHGCELPNDSWVNPPSSVEIPKSFRDMLEELNG